MTQSGSQPQLVLNVSAGPKASVHARHQTALEATDPRRTMAQVAKDIGLFAAAPFVTLAYVLLFPFIGMVLLAQAWRHRKQTG